MNATALRNRVAVLAKTQPQSALDLARTISDPWFRAQALSHVARYMLDQPRQIAMEAEAAALECDDFYKRSAVRAWEIAALAERGLIDDARKSLHAALSDATRATPMSSRCEALSLLLHAAARISVDASRLVAAHLRDAAGQHWRCDRAVVNASAILAHLDADAGITFANTVAIDATRKKCIAQCESGGTTPRAFYW